MNADSFLSWMPGAPAPAPLVPEDGARPPLWLGRWTEWKETTKAELEALRRQANDSVLDLVACELEDLLDRMEQPPRGLEAEAQRLGPRIRWRPDPSARLGPAAERPSRAQRLMVLHADGHRSQDVARAVEQALHGRGVLCSVRELYPELGAFFQGVWRGLWARCAAAGADFNDVLAYDRIYNEGRLLGVTNRLAARTLSARMRQQLLDSAAVVTCDPFSGQLLSYLRRVYSMPVIHHAVVVDRRVPALLYPAGCDAMYVPDAGVKANLLLLGEPEDVVQDVGVPLPRDLDGAAALKAIPREVLIVGRSLPGAYPMRKVLDALPAARLPAGCKVVYACAAGEDVEAPPPGAQVIWYTDQLPALLRRAAVAILPPDGVTLAEALAAGACPVLTPARNEAERANLRFAEGSGVGLIAASAEEAWDHAGWLLREPGELATRAARCLRNAAPDAARQVADRVIRSVRGGVA